MVLWATSRQIRHAGATLPGRFDWLLPRRAHGSAPGDPFVALSGLPACSDDVSIIELGVDGLAKHGILRPAYPPSLRALLRAPAVLACARSPRFLRAQDPCQLRLLDALRHALAGALFRTPETEGAIISGPARPTVRRGNERRNPTPIRSR